MKSRRMKKNVKGSFLYDNNGEKNNCRLRAGKLALFID